MGEKDNENPDHVQDRSGGLRIVGSHSQMGVKSGPVFDTIASAFYLPVPTFLNESKIP